VVTTPDWLVPTLLVDAQFEHLASSPRPIGHNTEVKFFHGAAEVPAHVRLLNDETLKPGQIGWAQFALREPIALVKGDRFIVRLPSPSITLGGGVVVDPHPGRRHRRFKPDVITRLETLVRGTPAELLLKTLESSGPLNPAELFRRAALSLADAQAALQELLETGQARRLREDLFISAGGWAALCYKIQAELAAYHKTNALKVGMPREELKSRLGLDTKLYNLIVEQVAQEGLVTLAGATLHAPNFMVVFKPDQQRAIDGLVLKFRSTPWNAPSVKESEQIVGADVLAALIDLGQLIKLSEEVVLLPETYQSGVEQIRAHLVANKTITVAQVRDLFNTSRKYALALMEYLDAQGITKRMGDERILR
jgi:selenocysteine-specific elongation factor